MSLYPKSVARCQHIKVNGTQCGSPALREEQYCYFHMRWRGGSKFTEALRKREMSGLPILEDANSIQVGLARSDVSPRNPGDRSPDRSPDAVCAANRIGQPENDLV